MFYKAFFLLCLVSLIRQSTSVQCFSCRSVDKGSKGDCYYVSNVTTPIQECFYGCYLYQYTVTEETSPTYTLSLKKGVKKSTKKTNTIYTERSCEPHRDLQCNPQYKVAEGVATTYRKNHCVICYQDLCNHSSRVKLSLFSIILLSFLNFMN
nr:uncharacterized protein LOC111513889 [Leptinotarsa decemlineata]